MAKSFEKKKRGKTVNLNGGVPCPHSWDKYEPNGLDQWSCAMCGAVASVNQVAESRWLAESGPAESRLRAAMVKYSPMDLNDIVRSEITKHKGFYNGTLHINKLRIARMSGKSPSPELVAFLLDLARLFELESRLEDGSLVFSRTCLIKEHPGFRGPIGNCTHPDCVVRTVLSG